MGSLFHCGLRQFTMTNCRAALLRWLLILLFLLAEDSHQLL